jgi:hypothetical protein
MLDKGAFDDGAIRLDESNRITVRGVTVREFYCDGIVWGISHDVLVENCHLYDGARLALHSGSGSQRSVARGNRVRRSAEGIYFCWGAQHGLYERNNRLENNRIVDSGGDRGIAIEVNGETESVRVIKNELRETRAPASRIGIRIAAEARDTRCEDNRIEGFAVAIADLQKK